MILPGQSDLDDPQMGELTFWRGPFGGDYIHRNDMTPEALSARFRLWRRIYEDLPDWPTSILEVGANIGLNLWALANFGYPALYAVEPNADARQRLVDDGVVAVPRIFDGTAADIRLPDGAVEMAFTSGVLIHIAPADLLASCREIHRVASRYIVCIEYFADQPQEVEYRGHRGKLFKRDFGAFWLDNFPDLKPLACGFAWKRMTGLDNLTYWVFSK